MGQGLHPLLLPNRGEPASFAVVTAGCYWRLRAGSLRLRCTLLPLLLPLSPGPLYKSLAACHRPTRPQIEGRENLPPPDQPAVYVANHLSFLVRKPLVPPRGRTTAEL